MPAYLDGFCPASLAQLEALHSLRLGIIGSVGEAAALGAYLDEEIRVTAARELTSFTGEKATKQRDFDVLSLQPLPVGWQAAAPDALGPRRLDPSIHACMVGGITAEIEAAIVGRDILTEPIPGLPESAYQLVERRTASGQRLFTPILGVLRAIRLAFDERDRHEDVYMAMPKAVPFHAQFEAARLPPEELLDDLATKTVTYRFLYQR